jgi:hypothetical protein
MIGAVVVVLIGGAAAAIPFLRPQPVTLETVRPAIAGAMEKFRMAYRNKDLYGIVAVYPTLPREKRQAMQKTFDDCLVYEVGFDNMQIAWNDSAPADALADVSSTHTCTPNSNQRQTKSVHHDLFTLKKAGDNWLIQATTPAPASPDRAQ